MQHVEKDPALCGLLDAQIPMGRRGEVDDVGPTVVFLASPAARYMTGQMIYVDGGITAQQTIWELPGAMGRD
jgi:NAD(P)-dependent dehydrogenase (short-subunit alcohol dehydrogenase family)